MMWDFFDKVYCISLTERPDRRREARDQFGKVGLSGRVEFHIVDKHPADPERGVYESHIDCMKKGLAAGARRILIFEDDIVFDRFDPEVLKNGIDFMTADPHWNLVMLGCMVKGSRATPYPSVRNIRYRSLTHACILNRPFAEKLARTPWHGVPYDDMLRDLEDDRFYTLCPSFAFQSNSPSDNERYLPLDRVRRIFGGLRRLQKMNEFYHRYRWGIIGGHVVVGVGVLGWFLLKVFG